MANVLVINQSLVKQLVSMEESVQIVEEAFTDFHLNKSIVYPAVREMVEEYNGIFGIKSSYLKEKSIGLKAGGFWKGNVQRGKTNHQSTMLLFNPETGEPVCMLDANYLTGIRTGAAGAVGAKYMARKDSKVIALIGAGVQSRTQLECLLPLFPIEEVLVYSKTEESAKTLANEIVCKGLKVRITDSAQKAVEPADIVVTTTPSFIPVLKTSWLKLGAHLNAMGSDTRGKREIEIDKIPDKVVCDFWQQSSIMGELQHGFPRDSVYAEIGQLTSGERSGRGADNEITMFDSTGIAVQDLSVAEYVYRKAQDLKLGVTVEL